MRGGSSQRGHVRFAAGTLNRVRRLAPDAGLTLRADAGFLSWDLIDKLTEHDTRFLIAVASNPAVESFFSTLTHELLHRRDWATRRQARRDIARWITDWYNTRRLHSTLDMISPTDYESTKTD